MQDYIFNSRRQAHRRRRRMLFRLFLLVLVLALATMLTLYLVERFHLFGSSTEEKAPEQPRDLIPLPPIEKTRPVSKTTPHSPAASTTAANSMPANAAAPDDAADRKAVIASTEPPTSASPARKENTIDEPARSIPAEPAEPKEAQAAPPAPPGDKAGVTWKDHRIAAGESLASIFQKLGLSPALLHQIVTSSKTAERLALIKPGQTLRFGFDPTGNLAQLILQRDRVNSLEVTRKDDGFQAREIDRPVEHRIATASGSIVSSLFIDGQKAGLSDGQIMELASLFGWDIDFALELRKGDRFSVIYQENWLDGEKLGNGPILAAEFVNRGKVYRAIRYTDSKGETAYYDTEGHAKRRAFIRTPVKFSRISSRFTLKRWHPILKKWRSHKGVDYAAPEGTPVKATGNGRVTFIGRKGGYGKVIFLHHGSRYTTVYGHLSRFARGLKTGSKVKQGQIIGYVGHTGLATGPHLHYEFRINGVHRNPLTVKLPKSIRLPKKELARFRRQIQPMVAQLDELRAQSMVASAASD